MLLLAKPKSLLKFSLFLLLAGLMSVLLRLSVPVSLARPSGSGSEICGTIANDITLTVLGSPYVMTCSVVVDTNATLTIEPGVTVTNDRSYGHTLEIEGRLEAVGTEDSPIVFTSLADNSTNYWPGLWFNGGTAHLNHVHVRHGGSQNIKIDNVAVNGEVFIENSRIEQAGNCGMKISTSALPRVRLVNNVWQANGSDLVCIIGGTLAEDATLAPQAQLDGYYHSGLTIASGITLTVEPGVTVMGDVNKILEVEGHLEAVGTEESPILFTSLDDNPSGNRWWGIIFNGGTGHLNHVHVRHGDFRSIEIENVAAGGEVLIENSRFEQNDDYAMDIWTDALPRVRLVNNVFYANGVDRIRIRGDQLVENATLARQAQLDGYTPEYSLTIANGITLTIEPGVTVMTGRFSDDELEIKGHLEAVGTEASPIVFTSVNDNPSNEWDGLRFNGGTGHLKHVHIRYSYGSNIEIQNVATDGKVLIENSTIEKARINSDGLKITSGKVRVYCSTIASNGDDGIQVMADGKPDVVVLRSEIKNNQDNGLVNQNDTQINAIDNWWDDASGPSGDGPGSGEKVSGNVLYDPWLTAPPPAECDVSQTPTPTATPATSTPTPTPVTNTPTPTATGGPTSTPTPTSTPIPDVPLSINFSTGAPGSYFMITGQGFQPNQSVSVSINGHSLGTIQADQNGELNFQLGTTEADAGHYNVTVTDGTRSARAPNTTESVSFVLDVAAPVRPQEGAGEMLEVPAGIADIADTTQYLYLPTIIR